MSLQTRPSSSPVRSWYASSWMGVMGIGYPERPGPCLRVGAPFRIAVSARTDVYRVVEFSRADRASRAPVRSVSSDTTSASVS